MHTLTGDTKYLPEQAIQSAFSYSVQSAATQSDDKMSSICMLLNAPIPSCMSNTFSSNF